MEPKLPAPRPCSMCSSKDYDGITVLVPARRGEIELCSRRIAAAVYECHLCGAVRVEPLDGSRSRAA